MAEVKRKKGESFDSLLRRFNRRIIQSGKVLQAKKIQYYKPKKNKTAAKVSALRRKELREKREYLRKIGRLTEERY
ncbi:30S ribosomal protein S21 [Candidatus Falkowbacteria bacterium]|nr:30S ribosomal protein S21 [Candidatus Falkowbacteria bacterium]